MNKHSDQEKNQEKSHKNKKQHNKTSYVASQDYSKIDKEINSNGWFWLR